MLLPPLFRMKSSLALSLTSALGALLFLHSNADAQSAFPAIEEQGAPLPSSVFQKSSSHAPSDLLEVYEIALRRDARLAAEIARSRARRTVLPQAASQLLPRLSASGNYSRQWSDATFNQPSLFGTPTMPITETSDRFNQYGWQITAEQTLIDFSAWHTHGSARAIAKQADVDIEQAGQELVSRTVRAYLDVLRARNALEFTAIEEETFKRQLNRAQKTYAAGVAALTDVLEAQAAYDDAVVRRVSAEGNQVNFITTLNTLTAYQFRAIGRVSEDFPIENIEPLDLDYWIGLAQVRNLEIRSLDFAFQASQSSVEARRAEFLPKLRLSGQYGRNYLGGRAAIFQGDEQLNRSVQLSLTVPIFQAGALSSRAKEAVYQREEAWHRLSQKRREVESEVRNAHQQVLTSVLRIHARVISIRSATKSLEAVQTGHKVGTRTILDVLQAEQLLRQSEFDYEVARYDYVLGVLSLRGLVGLLGGADIQALNRFIDLKNPVTF